MLRLTNEMSQLEREERVQTVLNDVRFKSRNFIIKLKSFY